MFLALRDTVVTDHPAVVTALRLQRWLSSAITFAYRPLLLTIFFQKIVADERVFLS